MTSSDFSGRRAIASAVAIAALSVAGCSDTAGPGFEHELATVRWEAAGLSDYSFVYDQLCYCPYTGPYRVTVEGGAVVAITPLPGASSIGGLELDDFPTIDDLLERLSDAADRDPVKFDVTYDEELGYPTSADVDISEEIVDEEYYFEVREFEAS